MRDREKTQGRREHGFRRVPLRGRRYRVSEVVEVMKSIRGGTRKFFIKGMLERAEGSGEKRWLTERDTIIFRDMLEEMKNPTLGPGAVVEPEEEEVDEDIDTEVPCSVSRDE